MDAARERLNGIVGAIADLESAGDQFRTAADRDRAYLSHAIPTMRSPLHARAFSIPDYLSFLATAGPSAPASSANAIRGLADDLGAKQKFEGFRIPNPVEASERWGGGERES